MTRRQENNTGSVCTMILAILSIIFILAALIVFAVLWNMKELHEGEWKDWSECSVTCGANGLRKRDKFCPTEQVCDKNLIGIIETEDCEVVPCPIDGFWSNWSLWSACAHTCGDFDTKTATRTCTQPEHGGRECNGADTKMVNCPPTQCPVHGGWSLWTEMTTCSATCGETRMAKKIRTCSDPAPAAGGRNCEGQAEEVTDCDLPHCPINGGWNPWSAWGACDQTCGAGEQFRNRLCASPREQYGGYTCYGDEREAKYCNLVPCPSGGGWGLWTVWQECSNDCDWGKKLRTRLCDTPPPAAGGEMCPGEATDEEDCMQAHCPRTGYWSSWEPWSDCTLTCNQGNRASIRLCDDPYPADGGAGCEGDEARVELCELERCPTDGEWGNWVAWSACSPACGAGTQTRTRVCDNPPTESGGTPCPELDTATKDCNTVC